MPHDSLSHAYLGSEIVRIAEKLISKASLIKGCVRRVFLIVSTRYINKAILC